MEFYTSQRSGKVMSFEGYEYIVHRELSGGVTIWRCREYRKYKCKARMQAIGSRVTMRTLIEHCHEADAAKCKANKLVSTAKTCASTQMTTTRSLIGTAVEGAADSVLAKINRSTTERIIRRARAKASMPCPVPTSTVFAHSR